MRTLAFITAATAVSVDAKGPKPPPVVYPSTFTDGFIVRTTYLGNAMDDSKVYNKKVSPVGSCYIKGSGSQMIDQYTIVSPGVGTKHTLTWTSSLDCTGTSVPASSNDVPLVEFTVNEQDYWSFYGHGSTFEESVELPQARKNDDYDWFSTR